MPNDTNNALGEAEPTRSPISSYPDSGRARRILHPARIIAVCLIILGLIILVYPFYPIIRYKIARPAPAYPYSTRLNEPDRASGRLPNVDNRLPTDNRLVIPKIGVDIAIIEGEDERSLFKGSWRIPTSSTPDQGGNTVLTVHRFQYLAGPNTLALADQLTTGDTIIVYWKQADGKMVEYDYRIEKTFLVTPDRVDIMDNTVSPRLTLFTCAPMFSTKNRLVIQVSPIIPTTQP
jgi:LPXTG-site transpeptidase (sortase) family protein